MPLSEDEKAELVAYLDGELDDAATQAVEAKIATNPDARAELDALKQTWGMLDYLPKASPSANFTNRTMERLSLEKVGPRKTMPMPGKGNAWAWRVGWAAAVLMALGGGYLATVWLFPAPAPVDPISENDRILIQHLRLAEKWRYFENTDDLEFIRKLDQADLFGDEAS
jgi:anti-sigma factor RsiW